MPLTRAKSQTDALYALYEIDQDCRFVRGDRVVLLHNISRFLSNLVWPLPGARGHLPYGKYVGTWKLLFRLLGDDLESELVDVAI